MTEPTVTRTFRLPLRLLPVIEARARLRGVSQNALVTELLEAGLSLSKSSIEDDSASLTGQAFGVVMETPSSYGSPATMPILVGHARIDTAGVVLDADAGWKSLLHPENGVSLCDLAGPGTSKAACTDGLRMLAEKCEGDAQIVLYRPDDPETPIIAGLELHQIDGHTYIRARKCYDGGQWTRRKRTWFSIPPALKAPN